MPEPKFPCCWHCEHVDGYVHMMDCLECDKGSGWMPPANPRTRKAQRHNGPLPDDDWTAPPPEDETVPGGSSPDQWQLIAIKLTEKGITTREGKLAFCTQHANRPITSSKELSWVEAAEIIRKADALPAAPGPLATKGTDQ